MRANGDEGGWAEDLDATATAFVGDLGELSELRWVVPGRWESYHSCFS